MKQMSHMDFWCDFNAMFESITLIQQKLIRP